MTGKLRRAAAPSYLFLCLLLGGSSQGTWGNAILRLIAVALVAWALVAPREEGMPRAIRQLLWLVGLALLLALLQLVPLPVSQWSQLPGREVVLRGYEVLGIALPDLPVSLSPYDTIETLLTLLPPLGMLAAMVGLRGYSTSWLAAALIGGTVLAVLLGILQVTSPTPSASPWYLYRQSNFGVATGFFANSNHMANLLLVTIPFIAALGATVRERAKDVRLRSAAIALVGGGLVVVVLGLVLNGSLAGYGLGVPVVIASLLMLVGFTPRATRAVAIAVGVMSLASLTLLWISPTGGRFAELGPSASVSSRQEIVGNSLKLFGEFAPLGAGLGTFRKAYPLTEDAAEVSRVHVNHAHNDYVEIAVETGVPGIILLLLFLGWWARSVGQMLKSPAADHFAVASAIASAAMLLHSVVDYPLRTAALGAVFAMCLALIVQSRRTARSETDLRPARHLIVD